MGAAAAAAAHPRAPRIHWHSIRRPSRTPLYSSQTTTMSAEVQKFTRKEVEASDPKTQPRFIINNHVYDVAKFLDEHPGGHEVLVNVVGKDATEEFDDIGHSLDAKELMKKFRVGELVEEDKRQSQAERRQVNWQVGTAGGAGGEGGEEVAAESFINTWKFPVVLGILVTVLYSYLFG